MRPMCLQHFEDKLIKCIVFSLCMSVEQKYYIYFLKSYLTCYNTEILNLVKTYMY